MDNQLHDFGSATTGNSGYPNYISRNVQFNIPWTLSISNAASGSYGTVTNGTQLTSGNSYTYSSTYQCFSQSWLNPSGPYSLAGTGNLIVNVYQGTTLLGSVSVPWQSTGNISYVAGGPTASLIYNTPTVLIAFNASTKAFVVTGGVGPPPVISKELTMVLFNNTGKVQTVLWGGVQLTLQPGANNIRYDGPVTTSGLPANAPSDFSGVPVTSPDGRAWVFASLDNKSGITGGVESDGTIPFVWRTPPPSSTPSTTQDQVTVISAGDSTHGALIGVVHPDGTTTMYSEPVLQNQTTTGTPSGTTATISDPTQPKPSGGGGLQIPPTANTTASGGTFTNTNVTVVGSDGSSKAAEDAAAMTQAQAIVAAANGTITPDARGTPNDLSAALSDARAGVNESLTFRVLATTAIPKTMTFPVDFDLGKFGSVHKTIDFSQNPFPYVRAAMVVCLTMAMMFAFMKRVTF